MISFLMSEPSRLLSFQQFRQNREIGCQVRQMGDFLKDELWMCSQKKLPAIFGVSGFVLSKAFILKALETWLAEMFIL